MNGVCYLGFTTLFDMTFIFGGDIGGGLPFQKGIFTDFENSFGGGDIIPIYT